MHPCQISSFSDIWATSTHRVLFTMFMKIKMPAACEMQFEIHFLNTTTIKPNEIDCFNCLQRACNKWFNALEMCATFRGIENVQEAKILVWMKIWCIHLKRRSRENRFTVTLSSLHCLLSFYRKLYLRNYSIENCVNMGASDAYVTT